MQNNQGKGYASPIEVQMVLNDQHPEIDLEGRALIKLDLEQPGLQVVCTSGMLWLTQEDDLHDHFLKAGQSFILRQRGQVLLQGLPEGKAFILPQPVLGVEGVARGVGQGAAR